jgi:hypothetical protein
MTVTRKSKLQPIELPNGASVVCKHDFLAIRQCTDGTWVHVFSRLVRCRGEHTQRSKVIYVAEPYILL